MAYIQSSGGEPIPPDRIVDMARLLGFSIPAEDLEAVATALCDQMASMQRLETLNLDGIAPSHPFDARWYD